MAYSYQEQVEQLETYNKALDAFCDELETISSNYENCVSECEDAGIYVEDKNLLERLCHSFQNDVDNLKEVILEDLIPEVERVSEIVDELEEEEDWDDD